MVLTTHYLEEAEKLADRVVILDHGHVVADGSPAQLMSASVADEIRFGAPPGLDTADLGQRLGSNVVESTPGEYIAATSPTPRHVADLASWLAEHDLPLADLRAGRQTLEDVFMRLTSGAADSEVTPVPSGRRRSHSRRL